MVHSQRVLGDHATNALPRHALVNAAPVRSSVTSPSTVSPFARLLEMTTSWGSPTSADIFSPDTFFRQIP